VSLALVLALCACTPANTTLLQASGAIEAVQVRIFAETSGRVKHIQAEKGQFIQAGAPLLTLEDELLQARLHQAQAAVDGAQAAVKIANTQLANVRIQKDQTVQGAQLNDPLKTSVLWKTDKPGEIKLPTWYFEKTEQLDALQANIQSARQQLETNQTNLTNIQKDISKKDFLNAEKRLAAAQAAYVEAQKVSDQANQAQQNSELRESAQQQLDTAKAELDSARSNYDGMITSNAAKDILKARADLATSQALLDAYLETWNKLQSGDDSLLVRGVNGAVSLAQDNVAQAEANLAQAQAALEVLTVQAGKLLINAPVGGVLLSQSVEVGEVVSPGQTLLELGKLETLKLKVYIPENRYGQVSLGQAVTVTIDSFPNQSFEGQVLSIADKAEFTPRNVQTSDGRTTTVYAVEIQLLNPEGLLKPGMPADVIFQPGNLK
jgi:HlyD family secretion protein